MRLKPAFFILSIAASAAVFAQRAARTPGAVSGARHARRGGGRQRLCDRRRHAHVLYGRQRGGCGRGQYFRRRHHRVFARRMGRGSADPDPHQRRQGARDRGRRHDAEAGHGGFLPQAPAAAGRNSGAAGEERAEGNHSRGGTDGGAGAEPAGRGAGGAARVRHEVVQRSGRAGD